jgi:hypothetical protein
MSSLIPCGHERKRKAFLRHFSRVGIPSCLMLKHPKKVYVVISPENFVTKTSRWDRSQHAKRQLSLMTSQVKSEQSRVL